MRSSRRGHVVEDEKGEEGRQDLRNNIATEIGEGDRRVSLAEVDVTSPFSHGGAIKNCARRLSGIDTSGLLKNMLSRLKQDFWPPCRTAVKY